MGDTDVRRDVIGEAHYDWSTTAPSIAVISAIAAVENVNPIDLGVALDTSLFTHIDPEALDELITSDNQIAVSFQFDKYCILIDGNELSVSYT